jgi:hypothetical protein
MLGIKELLSERCHKAVSGYQSQSLVHMLQVTLQVHNHYLKIPSHRQKKKNIACYLIKYSRLVMQGGSEPTERC